MLAAITYAGSATHNDDAQVAIDPGFITLLSSLVRWVRTARERRLEAKAAGIIEAHGGRLTDSNERLIALFLAAA